MEADVPGSLYEPGLRDMLAGTTVGLSETVTYKVREVVEGAFRWVQLDRIRSRERNLTLQLQVAARSTAKPWPVDVASALEVRLYERDDGMSEVYSDKGASVVVPPSYVDRVNALEFGTGTTDGDDEDPNPVIRPFLNRMSQYDLDLSGEGEE